MTLVVAPRLFVVHADLAEDFVLPDPLDDHLLLEIPPEIGERHVFLFEGGRERLFTLDLVVLLDAVEDGLELIVGHLVAELAAALDDEHFVDHVHHQVGGDLIEQLSQAHVGRVGILAGLAQGRDLPRLEIRLGEDFAVHLHQDLLDDFRSGAGDQQDRRDGRGEYRRLTFTELHG